MPRVRCDWDVCKHLNLETGYCECPDDVELKNEEIEVDDEEGGSELQQFLVCGNYEEAD